ncbi:response regulator transcription factor [Streptomyces sp. NPDC051917]|uniref:response regulator n=1 Tax=unclassified Streptomyces TaxID=2593676 RepID=UPI00344E2E53
MLRCLIIDDCPYFLQAARRLLEGQGVAVVGVASDSAQALLQAEQLRPEVVLVDIDLGAESGLELTRRLLSETGPSPPRVILVSNHSEDDYAELIEESPAVGFLGKVDLSGDAVRALLAKDDDDHQGGSVIEPRER